VEQKTESYQYQKKNGAQQILHGSELGSHISADAFFREISTSHAPLVTLALPVALRDGLVVKCPPQEREDLRQSMLVLATLIVLERIVFLKMLEIFLEMANVVQLIDHAHPSAATRENPWMRRSCYGYSGQKFLILPLVLMRRSGCEHFE